ncbi:MAG: hypothetical protein COA78_15805 [Blastopirellula sp.]|nr:MAG: hypothetical protein COA78_15805 [Blastopirellula sp.]
MVLGDTPKQLVRVSIIDVIETDGCIVKRISVNVPAGSRIQLLNDTDQAEINSSPAGDGRPTVHLNVLTDLLVNTEGELSTLKTIINLSGGTSTRRTVVASTHNTLETLVAFNAKPGRYALNERIPVLHQTRGRSYFLVVTMRQQ